MREVTLAFGADNDLVGTISLPAKTSHASTGAPPLGMVLFNAGVVHRVGPHRINVKLARDLARRGVPTLRFDLHGQGDSLGARGGLDYQQQVVADLQAAMNALQTATGAQGFALLGFCSGALPSIWVAQQDERVRHIVLYDAFSLQTRRSRLRFVGVRLRNHGLNPASLVLYVRRIGGVVQRLGATVKGLWWRARASGLAKGEESGYPSLGQLLGIWRQLATRGVRVSVLQAGADFSNVNDDAQIAQKLGLDKRDADTIHTGFLAPIDHIMTSVNAQQAFIDWIRTDLLERRAPERAARPAEVGGTAALAPAVRHRAD